MRALAVAVFAALFFAAGASAATSTVASGTSDVQYFDGTSWVSAPTVQANERYSTIPGTEWIAGTQGATDSFRVAVTLPDVYTDASISGSYYADNWATVSVNGVVAATQPAGDFGENYGYGGAPATPFTSAALHPGVNYLTFEEGNLGGPAGIDFAATVNYTPLATADQCKKDGWQAFGVFKNQGDCVSYVATGGSNPPANG